MPPTPRADGTPRAWVGRDVAPIPRELIEDLRRHVAPRRGEAPGPPRTPLDRRTLAGLAPIDRVRAQFEALRLALTPKGDGTGYYAPCPATGPAARC